MIQRQVVIPVTTTTNVTSTAIAREDTREGATKGAPNDHTQEQEGGRASSTSLTASVDDEEDTSINPSRNNNFALNTFN